MPPYRIRPKSTSTSAPHVRTPFIVNVPACEWCGVTGAHKCKGCERFTCWHCLVEYESGKCTHMTYNPVESTGWGIECPSPECDSTCIVCGGRGIVFTPQSYRAHKS